MADPVLFKLTADNGFTFSTSALREGAGMSASTSYNAIAILGRSSPLTTFSNGDPFTFSIVVELYAIEPDGQSKVSDVIKSFLSLHRPMKPGIKPPPKCKIDCGKILEEWECLCIAASPRWGQHNMWDKSGAPMTGAVDLTFQGLEIDNVSSEEWLAARNFEQLAFDGSS